MRRREFITLLGGVAAAATRPFGLHAQTSMPVIGFLRVTSAEDSAHLAKAFREGLKEAGLIDGQNVAIEFRFADGHRDRLPTLAGELIARRPAAIMTDQAVRPLKAATSTVPGAVILP